MWNRSNTEQFIEKAKTTHSEKYDYSLVDYKNSLTKVKIICSNHGEFEQTPKAHIRGGGCSECVKELKTKKYRKTKDKFIEEAIELYGDKYEYDLVEYLGNKILVKIICKNHGVFERSPNLFLSGDACRICSKKFTKSSSKELFIEEAVKVYGDKDDYTETNIISAKEKIEVRCTKHGYIFKKSIQNYLAGVGCPKCKAENYSKKRAKTTNDFIEKAHKTHGEFLYDYSDTVYVNSRTKLDIICKTHGAFNQYPQNHIAGNGCPKCAFDEFKNNASGYLRDGYIKIAKGRKAIVYLIRCKDENEEFYKIGKTLHKVNKRFIKSNLPYMFEEITTYNGEAGYIFDLEIELHKKYKLYKYEPSKTFGGHTECYNLDLPIDEIINYFFN
jgi:Zn finger protein HypA/HybF involved in hydrogenase expression